MIGKDLEFEEFTNTASGDGEDFEICIRRNIFNSTAYRIKIW